MANHWHPATATSASSCTEASTPSADAHTGSSLPQTSLLDSRFHHDSCGVGFVARVSNEPSHEVLAHALTALGRLAHRGAVAADGKSSDGVGIMTQVPRNFLLRAAGLSLKSDRTLAVGVCFFPADLDPVPAQKAFEEALKTHRCRLLAWREVPTSPEHLGQQALASAPRILQALISAHPADLDHRLFLARKQFERRKTAVHICSLSDSTIVYKALCAGRVLADYYPDLADPGYETAFAIFHQRYATNSEPAWSRAQPLRMLAHNGEINTVWGNRARMDARASTIPAEYYPLYSPDGSDSTSLDEAVELLARNGRSVSQAVRMLVPPAKLEKVSEFMHYHADCVEPWDGPAALTFADGHLVGAALDRNGLRPCRYFITRGGLVVAGSEAGLVDLDPESILESGRLGPGEMLVVDLKSYEVLNTREILARFDREVEYETLVSDLALTDAEGWRVACLRSGSWSCIGSSATREKTCAWCCSQWLSMARTPSGRWGTTRPSLHSPAPRGRFTTICASASPRSPIRPSMRCAKRASFSCTHASAHGPTCWTRMRASLASRFPRRSSRWDR